MAKKKTKKQNELKPIPYVFDPRQTEFDFVKDCSVPGLGVTPHDRYDKVDEFFIKQDQMVPLSPAPAVGLQGWICPVCGRVLSPGTSVCPCYAERMGAEPRQYFYGNVKMQAEELIPGFNAPDYNWPPCHE